MRKPAVFLLCLSFAGLAGACATVPSRIPAYAVVECAHSGGKPNDCRVTEESHANLGLGDQAVAIISRGQLTQRTVSNSPDGARFRTRIQFELDAKDIESGERPDS
ncbi:hypothetical protein GCM10009093_13970 [Brevundimonas terrae]|uniref:Lipoprotein n=1 Tax=Brevundimonas terrae TaxID=363631 RepID=A0ABP3I2M7_9CAUL|nr:hypothetical protein [Brevundimonas terrae]NIJ27940.1 hypothetical protein [Brevundimonas terrae]